MLGHFQHRVDFEEMSHVAAGRELRRRIPGRFWSYRIEKILIISLHTHKNGNIKESSELLGGQRRYMYCFSRTVSWTLVKICGDVQDNSLESHKDLVLIQALPLAKYVTLRKLLNFPEP